MILVTGGTGYIGSHTCVALAQAGHDIVILDNLSNSRVSVIDRMETLCGKRPKFIQGHIHLGRLDQPLAQIRVPGRQTAHDEQVREQIRGRIRSFCRFLGVTAQEVLVS
jgi:nucleoside-diphosphate-sugar epimerase